MLRPVLVWVLLVALCGASTHPLVRPIPGIWPSWDCRIVGGWPVSISQYPWQLYLTMGGHVCGASIISPHWALTAAHCVAPFSPSQMLLRAGTSIRGSGGTTHDIAAAYTHELYLSTRHDYDIAVLQVSNAFRFGLRVRAVGLAWYEPSAGMPVTVTGWGETSYGGNDPTTLLATTVLIVDRDICRRCYIGITLRMICAGVYGGGRGTCRGDSGGALVYRSTQVGIVSWGCGCTMYGNPCVYVNVANLRSWIRGATGV